ncbi:cation:proton antiporter [Candidatus Pacebacteria bacterium]|nr:cation:proton antiporter [Candidatus Paceibacterota bacterium]
MESTIFSFIAFISLAFVALNALAYYTRRVSFLPEIIWVLLLGIGYGFVSTVTELPRLDLEPELVLFVFVPILVFASTQKMCLSAFRQVLKPATIAATVGIVISMLIIAGGLHLFLGLPLLAVLLFGVVMSATDPLAVDALLDKNTNINPDTKLLIEGESILNDGFVVTVFGILSILLFEAATFDIVESTGSLVLHIVGALVVGILLAYIARQLLRIWSEERYIFLTNMTLALSLGSFLAAELLGFSGILSVFAAALTFGYKPMSRTKNTEIHQSVWDYYDYIANSALFFILGASFFTTVSLSTLTFGSVLLVLGLLFLSRYVSLKVLNPWLMIKGKPLSKNDLWILNFAGARGAVGIALILLLPDSFEYKELFLSLAFVMIVFSLVVYPAIMERLLKNK